MTRQEGHSEANPQPACLTRDYWIAGLSLAAGTAVGATVMYLCDPDRGKARRTRMQEQAAGAVKRQGRKLAGKVEDIVHRAKGNLAQAKASLYGQQAVDDAVLYDRVRSRIGHVSRHAHTIETTVLDGVVTLSGTVPRSNGRQLAEEVQSVPGVREVHDHMVELAV
ncbi:MAG: BON domain-containing protein [Acidobacteriia bacterium]|nr:BON domain-containing protein [Terriglobia bacterium]